MDRRVLYATAVYDQDEIDAVLAVLDRGRGTLRLGKNVAEMEREIAARFGKARGVMCNSGSSALYLAVELLDLPPGSEVITSPLTFSTDLAPLIRGGLVPAFVDVEPDTFNVDVDAVEAMIGPETRAILIPNLAGNAPDWDRLRAVADRRGLLVVEDSCDALGARLRGTPTGMRSHISVTSFALSHIITCAGNGGMVMLDDDALVDRCLSLRRWGRRSEPQLFGSRKGNRNFWEDLDGIRYDNLFIFDDLGWNFEPSELGAAFGLQQLKKLPQNYARRQRSFELYSEFLGRHPDRFVLPRQTDGLVTAWLSYVFLLRKDAGFTRGDLQAFLEHEGIETRTVWSGNVARQPMMRGVRFRQPDAGLPNADAVMERGMLIPMSHALSDDDIAFVCSRIEAFLDGSG
ncbi:MAG TPA: DegT/DnrJ/EryC1/StrS aminotransferase family protein [Acidimicrobiia bacterium]|nr:DegT/DnrJ/EryC1/StrS aminotransferase family protein [Acidimicrobiia bacterium]